MTSRPRSWIVATVTVAMRFLARRRRLEESRPTRRVSPNFVEVDTSAFYLEGWLDGSPVSALWDGEELTMTDSLLVLANLADAVDAIYAEAGLDPASTSSFAWRSPGWTLTVLVKLCDRLNCVEYQGKTGLKKLV